VSGRPHAGHVRPAESGDLDALTEIWTEITQHHAPLDPLFTLRPGAAAQIRKLLRAVLRDPDAATFVFEADGAVVGMSCVRIDRAPPILRETRRAEITDLGVRRERRRRGVGLALAQAALDWVSSQGVDRVEVRVTRGNRAGQAFWRSLGFGDFMDVLQRRL
jgi:ribosomal protein S18 acetylase RimI-like enzyme